MKTINITKDLYQFTELQPEAQSYAVDMIVTGPYDYIVRSPEDLAIARHHARIVLEHTGYWYDKWGVQQF